MYAPANISAELRAIAASDRRPAAKRLRDHFDDVQAAIASGVRRMDVLEILARNGLVMTFKTFVRTLARIRKERGLARSKAAPTPAARPAVTPTDDAPNQAVVRQAASDAAAAPATTTTPPAVRERRPLVPIPAGTKLPDDWLTADLTRDQMRLLTFQQKMARAEAETQKYFPNPFDPVPPKKDNPA